MAYFMVASCINCGTRITFNPHLVPSLIVNGTKEPLCKNCADKWNQIHRISKGLEPVPIQEGAYEPQKEVTDTDYQEDLDE